MPVIPAAASFVAYACTPPSVAALNPAEFIAVQSVEEKRKMPRVTELEPVDGFSDGEGLGLGDGGGVGLGDGEGLGLGDGLGEGDAAPVSRGRMSPTLVLAELPSNPTP